MRALSRAAVRSALALSALAAACSGPEPKQEAGAHRPVAAVRALRQTAALSHDPDDPAIWLNRADPPNSLVLGTVKVAAPNGGLAVFGLDGALQQLLTGPDRPNNVDVEYGLAIDASPTDIAVLTERLGRRLRVYSIVGGRLRDISAGVMPILEGATGDEGAPMGVALYRRAKDGAVYAIVSPKAGPRANYLWQYRLEDNGTGRVRATFVRRFGIFSGVGEIESIAIDDELGYVYYADEAAGIHKWHADPDAFGADTELALFGTTGYQQDREGIGIYTLANGKGYIVAVDQLDRESVFHLYAREGEPGRPHDHSRVLLSFTGGADGTDGLDVTSADLGHEFPTGLLVAMNSSARNFLLFDWRSIAAAATPPLRSTSGSAIHPVAGTRFAARAVSLRQSSSAASYPR